MGEDEGGAPKKLDGYRHEFGSLLEAGEDCRRGRRET